MRTSLGTFLTAAAFTVVSPIFAQPSTQLTLDQAVRRALELSPTLAAEALAVSAAEARVTQAGLLPNPEVEVESENFGGGEDLRSFDAAESTALISQRILLGGKRGRRRAVAESDHQLAGRNREAARLDVIAGTTSSFYRVLAAQEREALARELLGLAEQLASTVQARVDAGKVSPVEATRASIEAAQTRVRLARAEREMRAARILLAASWGSSTATFEQAIGELPEPTPPPTLQRLRTILMEAPEITRLENQIERQKRVVDLERSFRVPDLTVRLGSRWFQETGQSAWIAGVSLPIPIFDRNQGLREASELELERTRADGQAVRIALEAKLASALERLRTAALEADVMGREIVPAANAAFAATETGYNEGKFAFLSVLDAQRALFEARSLFLDSREDYALTLAELERLIGRRWSPQAEPATRSDGSSHGEPR